VSGVRHCWIDWALEKKQRYRYLAVLVGCYNNTIPLKPFGLSLSKARRCNGMRFDKRTANGHGIAGTRYQPLNNGGLMKHSLWKQFVIGLVLFLLGYFTFTYLL